MTGSVSTFLKSEAGKRKRGADGRTDNEDWPWVSLWNQDRTSRLIFVPRSTASLRTFMDYVQPCDCKSLRKDLTENLKFCELRR
jgi:hypothetical protein